MIHVTLFHADSQVEVGGQELLEQPVPEGGSVWIDLEGRSRNYERLLLDLGFHPLAVEDVFTLEHLPKLEEYPDSLFVILRGIDANRERLGTLKLAAFLQSHRLITCHRAPMRSITVVRRLVAETGRFPGDMVHVFYRICDELVDHYFPVVEEIGRDVEELEEELFDRPDQEHLERLREFRHRLSTLRRVLLPHRKIFNRLGSRQVQLVNEREAFYFRDVYDNVFRLVEAVDHQREQLASTKDTYLSAVSQRTNEVMKVLTLFSAVLLPLTFITGVYGMNFEVLPGAHGPHGFFLLLGGMATLAGGMILWFKRKRWF